MIITMCVKCANMPEETRRKAIDLIRRGAWLCPNGKNKCGTVDGKTQTQMRDDIFKSAILEMVSPSGRLQ